MPNPLERYLEIAAGLTTATVHTAERVVQRLVQEGEVAADRAERTVTEVLDASQRNRDALMELVRSEVDRAVERLNLATRADLERLEARMDVLEQRAAPATGSGDRRPDEGGPEATVSPTAARPSGRTT